MFKMHPNARAEPVLAARGITTAGAPVFVALAAGGSESTDAWGDFFDESHPAWAAPPLLVISDGAAGLINAAESSLPSYRAKKGQRPTQTIAAVGREHSSDGWRS